MITTFECRPHCGACCTAPSISSAIPDMPNGKSANTPCIQLDAHLRCKIFGQSTRPRCCAGLQSSQEMCGNSREEAMIYLQKLEQQTQPHFY